MTDLAINHVGAPVLPLSSSGRMRLPDPPDDEAEIALDELLRSVRLTPRQTAFVATEIVRAVGLRHERGGTHGSVATAAIRIGLRSGRVRLMDPEGEEQPEDRLLRTTPLSAEHLRRADLQATAATVAGLTEDTRTPAAQRDPGRRALLIALDELGAALTVMEQGTDGTEAQARLAALARVAGPCGRHPGAAQEVAALAAATGGPAPSDGPLPVHATRPAAGSAPRTTPTPQSGRSVWTVAQRGLARFSLLLVGLAVVGLVIVGEFTFLGSRLAGDLGRLTGTGTQTAAKVGQTTPGGVRGPAPLPVLGPGSAGAVTAVDLRVVGVCKPGSRCLLRIGVAVHPRRAGLKVGWSVVVVDRCTGARTGGPTGAMHVPAAAGTAAALTEVQLPHRAVALVAETTTPARTAGIAVPVPARAGSC